MDLDRDHVPGHEVVQMRKIRTTMIWIRVVTILALKFWNWLKKVLALQLKRNVAGFRGHVIDVVRRLIARMRSALLQKFNVENVTE